jgi:hypothetical protein
MAETEGQNELLHRQLAKCPTGILGLDEITGGVLPWCAAARLQQEAQERVAALTTQEELEHRRRVLDRKCQIMEAQVAVLQAEMSAEEVELQGLKDKSRLQQKIAGEERERLALARKADAPEFEEDE